MPNVILKKPLRKKLLNLMDTSGGLFTMMWFLKVSALFQNLKSPGFGKVAHADNTALLQKVEEGYNYALLLRSDHWQKLVSKMEYCLLDSHNSTYTNSIPRWYHVAIDTG